MKLLLFDVDGTLILTSGGISREFDELQRDWGGRMQLKAATQ